MSKNIDMSYDIQNEKVSMDYDKTEIVLNNGQQFFVKTTVDTDVIYEVRKGYWGFRRVREIADFYDAVENDIEPTISDKEALKIQKLIYEIYEKGTKNFERNSNS